MTHFPFECPPPPHSAPRVPPEYPRMISPTKHSLSTLSRVLSLLAQPWVRTFLLSPDPLHLPILTAPLVASRSLSLRLNELFIARAPNSTASFAANLLGRSLLIPAFSVDSLTLGVGVKHMDFVMPQPPNASTPQPQLIPDPSVSAAAAAASYHPTSPNIPTSTSPPLLVPDPIREHMRFVGDVQSSDYLIVRHRRNSSNLFLELFQPLSATRRRRTILTFDAAHLRAMLLAPDNQVSTDDLARSESTASSTGATSAGTTSGSAQCDATQSPLLPTMCKTNSDGMLQMVSAYSLHDALKLIQIIEEGRDCQRCGPLLKPTCECQVQVNSASHPLDPSATSSSLMRLAGAFHGVEVMLAFVQGAGVASAELGSRFTVNFGREKELLKSLVDWGVRDGLCGVGVQARRFALPAAVARASRHKEMKVYGYFGGDLNNLEDEDETAVVRGSAGDGGKSGDAMMALEDADTGTGDTGTGDSERVRVKTKAEVRREKNRLSAMRCNREKKIRSDQLKVQLADARKLLQSLTAKEATLRVDNSRLRGMIKKTKSTMK